MKTLLRAAFTACTCLITAGASAQSSPFLSLEDAKAMARLASPELIAAREALEAARGHEQQAGIFSNPDLVFSNERTSSADQVNTQRIFGLEQRLELGGLRAARRRAAGFRRSAAEAKVEFTRAQVDYEVTRAYASAISADRKRELAREAAAAFSEAGRVSAQRVAAGDISVYADRRLRLEAARYAVLESEAVLAGRSARIALSGLVTRFPDSIGVLSAILTDTLPEAVASFSLSFLQSTALRNRSDYRSASLEAEAFVEDARVAFRERIPSPVISAGLKTEKSAGLPGSFTGFALGVSIPLPVFDRRRGAIQAANAEARMAAAQRDVIQRRIIREVADAYEGFSVLEQQRSTLAQQLGAQSAAALRSARIAYAEGEITLLEWLDAVRAYNEAESAYSTLLAEFMIRRATLERVTASPLRLEKE